MKRIVLDTNVLISALFWEGPPRIIYRHVRRGSYGLLMCKEIEEEIARVLAYPKFQLSPQPIFVLLRDIQMHSVRVRLRSRVEAIAEDPSDNVFLACAVDGKADAVVSGDSHMLKLGTYQKIPICTARQFVEQERLEETK